MRNILITGGSGYLGSALALHLSKQGYHVFITSRSNKENSDDIRVLDLLDEKTFNGLCENIDAVIHTAAFGAKSGQSPKDVLLANGYGTKLLLEEAKKQGVKKFIYLSTFHVYGKSEGYIDENTLVNPLTDYSLTHYVGEMYCYQYANEKDHVPIIVRITNGYGLPSNASAEPWELAVNHFCKEAVEYGQLQINSAGTQLRDFISVNDIVSAIRILLQTDRSSKSAAVYNISSQNAISINELSEMIAVRYHQIFGKELNIIHPFNSSSHILNETPKLLVSSEKLRALNWFPKSDMMKEIDAMLTIRT